MTETNLYSYRISKITLSDTITKFQKYLDNGIALLYSPHVCQLAKLAKLDISGNLSNSQGENIELNYQKSYIFEARIFNENHELRWLNKCKGEGDAVLICEETKTDLTEFSLKHLPYLEKLKQKYLLWGEKTKTQLSNGWLRLSTARIGSLDIPLGDSIRENQRVYLNTVEYLAEVDDFGNVSVIEERLVNLEVK